MIILRRSFNSILSDIVFITLFVFPFSASAICFKQETYDECLINGLKGTTSDVAAIAIKNACAEKFPSKTKKVISLHSPDALANVTGTINLSEGSVSGMIYNQLPFKTPLVGVTIAFYYIDPISNAETLAGKQSIELNISPFTSSSFCASINSTIIERAKSNGFKWRFDELRIVQSSNQ